MALYKTPEELAADQEKRDFEAAIADLKLQNQNLYLSVQNFIINGVSDKRLDRIILLTDNLVNAANDIKRRLDKMGLIPVPENLS